jgi:large subunit ribosomal protein L29
MEANELRDKAPADLRKLLLEKRREQFNLRMQRGSGQQARPSQMRAVQRDIARIKTVMNEQRRASRAK